MSYTVNTRTVRKCYDTETEDIIDDLYCSFETEDYYNDIIGYIFKKDGVEYILISVDLKKTKEYDIKFTFISKNFIRDEKIKELGI